jgi:micrococcal nuclease
MKPTKYLIPVALMLFAGPSFAMEPLKAKVSRIIDGDTIEVTVKVRLRGIDTPELRGKCPSEIERAEAAKQAIAELAAGRVTLRKIGVDRYGRLLATVRTREGKDIGSTLVNDGHARVWRGKREEWCD